MDTISSFQRITPTTTGQDVFAGSEVAEECQYQSQHDLDLTYILISTWDQIKQQGFVRCVHVLGAVDGSNGHASWCDLPDLKLSMQFGLRLVALWKTTGLCKLGRTSSDPYPLVRLKSTMESEAYFPFFVGQALQTYEHLQLNSSPSLCSRQHTRAIKNVKSFPFCRDILTVSLSSTTIVTTLMSHPV